MAGTTVRDAQAAFDKVAQAVADGAELIEAQKAAEAKATDAAQAAAEAAAAATSAYETIRAAKAEFDEVMGRFTDTNPDT